MMYTVKENIDSNTWRDFLITQPHTLFTQSPEYGIFYDLLGEGHTILGIYNKQKILVGGALVVTIHAKRGNFLYLPYGPILPEIETKQALETIANTLKKKARTEGFSFIRISPYIIDTPKMKKCFSEIGFRLAPMHMLAETTWVLTILKDEDTLLANMKKNHRNLIRRCEKKDVHIDMRTDQNALDILHTMLDETKKRHHFVRFSRKYIDTEFNTFAKVGDAVVFIATLPNGEIDAAAIIFFFGNMAVYRHSGSLNKDKRLPTSYAIQWAAIKEAKRRGCTYYNFWGIAPSDAPQTHPFHGITHFKTGFGGFQQDLLHCQDMQVSWKYWINWIIESVRSVKRGFHY